MKNGQSSTGKPDMTNGQSAPPAETGLSRSEERRQRVYAMADGLTGEFSTQEFMRHAGLPMWDVETPLRRLRDDGLIKLVSANGGPNNSRLWKRTRRPIPRPRHTTRPSTRGGSRAVSGGTKRLTTDTVLELTPAGEFTVMDLAALIGCSYMVARYHLHILIEHGEVESVGYDARPQVASTRLPRLYRRCR